MSLAHFTSQVFACIWGIKDRDYSPFLVRQASRELAFDRDHLDRLILYRLQEILRHAEQTSPYYARTFAEYGVSSRKLKSVDDMSDYPCITREALRESLPEILSGGKVLPSWKKISTGGTTSSPIAIYCDMQAAWKKNAFSRAMDCWYGRQLGDRVAFLWGAHHDFSGRPTLGMRLRNLTYKHYLVLPSSPLDNKILEKYHRQLVAWKPSFLHAYPTPLYEYCLFLRQQGLSLPSLRGVSVTAEVLFPKHRQLIEGTLGLRVYNWYGSRELGRVASECDLHDGMHVNEPSVFVEIEPDSNIPDDCGHLIVTDLFNRATPLIRYRTGDIARFHKGNCACGSSLRKIENLLGRTTDLIVLSGGRKVRMTNHCDFSQLKEIQMIQKSPKIFLLRYVRGPAFSDSSLLAFTNSFQSISGFDIILNFEEVECIPRERSGKIRLVINEMNTFDRSDA